MTRKLRALSRVRDVRKRMRDVAASSASVALEAHFSASEAHNAAMEQHDLVLGGLAERLEGKTFVGDLLGFESERQHAERAVVEAAQIKAARAVEAERAKAQLAARARDLESSERLIERTRAHLTLKQQQAEQRMVDDLIGAALRRVS